MSLELERFLNLLDMMVLDRGSTPAQSPANGGTAGSTTNAATRPPGDAIDAALAAPARETAVVSLREAPEVLAFRQELVDGLIRADTMNQLLNLVNTVVSRLLM